MCNYVCTFSFSSVPLIVNLEYMYRRNLKLYIYCEKKPVMRTVKLIHLHIFTSALIYFIPVFKNITVIILNIYINIY
jgi:hypothetical protein